jgi:ABC-2 type transport system permease protein
VTALLRGELIKAVTTRTLFGYAALGVALAIANVLIMTLSNDLVTVADKQEAIAGLPMLLILFGLVGAAGEYRHRTAAPAALAAGGSRGRVLLARAGAYAVTGLVLGGLAAAVSLALGLPLLSGEGGLGLGFDEIAAVATGSVVGAGLCAIMGVAAGALVRNQVVGVVGALLLMFVAMPLLNVADETAAELSPFGAAVVLAGDPAVGGTLSWGMAGLVLAAWTVPLLFAAIVLERRRDLA